MPERDWESKGILALIDFVGTNLEDYREDLFRLKSHCVPGTYFCRQVARALSKTEDLIQELDSVQDGVGYNAE